MTTNNDDLESEMVTSCEGIHLDYDPGKPFEDLFTYALLRSSKEWANTPAPGQHVEGGIPGRSHYGGSWSGPF